MRKNGFVPPTKNGLYPDLPPREESPPPEIPKIVIADYEGSDTFSIAPSTISSLSVLDLTVDQPMSEEVPQSSPQPSAPPAEEVQTDEQMEEKLEEHPETWMRGEDENCKDLLPNRNWTRHIREGLRGLGGRTIGELTRYVVKMDKCGKCKNYSCTMNYCSSFHQLLQTLVPTLWESGKFLCLKR